MSVTESSVEEYMDHFTMKGLAGILLFVTILWQADALKCRRCVGASSLDDCTSSVTCDVNEICYMDEVVTASLTIEYNGGCRKGLVCLNQHSLGKRAASGTLSVCSGCCGTDSNPECNTKLCGIKSNSPGYMQCYYCNSKFGGTGVQDPYACTNVASCQSDEFCSADTYQLGATNTYEFGCIPKGVCTLLTREALHRRDECVQYPSTCPVIDGGFGRRESSGQIVCSACCGDNKCNGDSCDAIIDRLYRLWKAGMLDMTTLKTNGTLPSLTTTTRASRTTTRH